MYDRFVFSFVLKQNKKFFLCFFLLLVFDFSILLFCFRGEKTLENLSIDWNHSANQNNRAEKISYEKLLKLNKKQQVFKSSL